MSRKHKVANLARLNRRREGYFPLKGGLNLVDSPLTIPPGELLAGMNYMPAIGAGYTRIGGFEPYDGRPAPSDADYWILNFTAGSVAISAGDTITGSPSGATGLVLVDAVVTSGSYVGADAAGYIVFTSLTGNFVDAQAIQVSAVTRATSDGVEAIDAAVLNSDHLDWKFEAAEIARAAIAAVPGSGSIRGVYVYAGGRYAFRDNAGGTAVDMYKASAAGWVLQTFGETIDFTAGTLEFAEGETLTGVSSGATATIDRVVLQSGIWGSTAAGYLVLSSVAGGPFTNPETVTSASGSATSASVNAAITLPAGGKYEFETHNFYGHTKTRRMYGVNGVGSAFEWDGTVFAPIRIAGMTTDTPTHLAVHKGHLFLTFPGGSLQHSATGDPLDWSASLVLGAGELGIGEELTAIKSIIEDALAVAGRNKMYVLYGTDSSTWDLKGISDETGAIEWTLQKIGQLLYLDDRGVTRLSAVQAYGNFADATLSHKVQKLIESKRTLVSTSAIVRTKNQYRLFFTDGTGVIMTFEKGKLTGVTELDYGIPVRVITSEEDSSGTEVSYFGSDDGYIYQADKGTSFAGTAIIAWLILPYYHYKTPSHEKRFYKVTPELDASADTVLYIQPDFAYGDPNIPAQAAVSVLGGGGSWNVDNWGAFLWSSQVVSVGHIDIDGEGVNMGLRFYSNTDREPEHTIHGVTTQYSIRKVAL